ncbi:MAG TPA: sulfite exporter TauE/SafE family protein [candidate division Zixibacteria bacterium]|nr:sulfite exporter TauE/SafE family protein [candidate division Zixibacteria bacterium]
MEPLSVFLILIPIGLAVGIFAAITGLGGGVLMVPILFLGIFAFSEPFVDSIKYATTISSTVILFTAMSGTVAFTIQKRIDFIVGLLCAPFTVLGAWLGKLVQTGSAEVYVLMFFAILLAATAIRMLAKVIISRIQTKKQLQKDAIAEEAVIQENKSNEKKSEPSRFKLLLDKMTLNRDVFDRSEKQWQYKARLYLTPIAVIGGFVASMAGVGGGIVMVPVLHLIIGLPIHFATATSVFIMIFTKLSTITTSYTNSAVITEGIWWPYVTGLAIGIVVGTQIGAIFARKIKADPLKIIFATVLLLVAIWTIIEWQLGLS